MFLKYDVMTFHFLRLKSPRQPRLRAHAVIQNISKCLLNFYLTVTTEFRTNLPSTTPDHLIRFDVQLSSVNSRAAEQTNKLILFLTSSATVESSPTTNEPRWTLRDGEFDWKAVVCTKCKLQRNNHIKESLRVKLVATFFLLKNWKIKEKLFVIETKHSACAVRQGKGSEEEADAAIWWQEICCELKNLFVQARQAFRCMTLLGMNRWQQMFARQVHSLRSRDSKFMIFLFCFTLCKCRKPFCAAHCTHIPLIHEVLLRFIVIVASLRS